MAADTDGPRRVSETSSILRVETPAGRISITASSTPVSRRRHRSMMAVVKRAPLSLGMCRVTSPELVVRLRSWWPAR